MKYSIELFLIIIHWFFVNIWIRINSQWINNIINFIINFSFFNKWNITRRLNNTTLFWLNFTELRLVISNWSLCINYLILFRQTIIDLIAWISYFFNVVKIIINDFKIKFSKENRKKSRLNFHHNGIDVIFMLQNTISFKMDAISCQRIILWILFPSYWRNQILIDVN